MANKIGILSPLLAGLGRIFGPSFEVVNRGDFASDLAMAAAHPDIRALVVIGGEKLEHATVEAFPNLGLIACYGVGFDGVDAKHARARGVEVTNCPNVNNEDVADHAIGIWIALVRGIVAGHERVLNGGWTHGFRGVFGPSLRQMRCGIAGFGAIGQSIARRLPGFGVTDIQWWGPNPKPDIALPRAESLQALAAWSDALFVAARADETSRNMITADILAALGPQGYLVNITRGFTVDEDALIAALKAKTIAGAALDVFVEEPTPPARWKDVPNIVVTPHIGGAGRGAAEAQTRLVLENLTAFLVGQPVKTPVPA